MTKHIKPTSQLVSIIALTLSCSSYTFACPASKPLMNDTVLPTEKEEIKKLIPDRQANYRNEANGYKLAYNLQMKDKMNGYQTQGEEKYQQLKEYKVKGEAKYRQEKNKIQQPDYLKEKTDKLNIDNSVINEKKDKWMKKLP